MQNAKKILITTESHEIFIMRIADGSRAFGHCGHCGREVEILTLDQAVSFSGLNTRELVHLAETKKIHPIETESGHMLICYESAAHVKAQKRSKQ